MALHGTRTFALSLASLALLSAAACVTEDADGNGASGAEGADAGGSPSGTVPTDYGVPVDGLPNYDERIMLMAINRTRADPNSVEGGTGTACTEWRDPQPPVLYDHDAAQAARFHCLHLGVNGGGLSHRTFCELRDDLEDSGCEGEAACSCVEGTECWSCETLGGCGTGPDARMSLFGFGGSPAGEVGAGGYGDSWSAVSGWITESPCDSTTLAHRNTLTAANANVVGTGAISGANCWGTYHFADFGRRDNLALPALASGVHQPQQGGAGSSFSFYANYYHAAGAPRTIHVVLDGVCQALALELGTEANGTYLWQGELLEAGCLDYYFSTVDPLGRRSTYPSAGAYRVGVGETCESDYTPARTTVNCN